MIDNAANHTPTPEFGESLAREIARRVRHEARFAPGKPDRRRWFGMIVGLAAAATVALAIGLVFGANTGYASARVEGDRQRNEMAANAIGVTSQVAALRIALARTRADIARRTSEAGATSLKGALLNAQAELRTMEASAERIELDLDLTPTAQASPRSRSALIGGTPVKRALAVTCNALAFGAAPEPPQQGIPIVELAPVSGKTTTTLGGMLGVRQLASGKVLVNDPDHRQIRLFDSTLAGSVVVSDSIAGSSNSYGPIPGRMIRYRGDSSLFADLPSRSLLVLDGGGQVARVWALPNDPDAVTSLILRPSAADLAGRLIYMKPPAARNVPAMATDSASVAASMRDPGDSLEIVRADLDTRRLDTVGRVMQPARGHLALVPTGDGKTRVARVIQPLLTLDEWAVLSDGTLAFVRGHDYHVDWVRADGTKSSTGKLPFDWRRLTEDDKRRLIDSTRIAQDSAAARGARLRANNPGGGGRGRSGGGGTDPAEPRAAPPPIEIAAPNEIPDYYPPIRPGAAIADLDDNLWILPATSAQSQHGELVYDVVNVKQGLFQRVRMPVGRSIAGFGKGGLVYLLSGDRANGFALERTKLAARQK